MWTSAWRTSKCVDVALENAPMSAVSEFLRPVSPPGTQSQDTSSYKTARVVS